MHIPTRGQPWWLVALALGSAGVAIAASPPPPKPVDRRYLGTEACGPCHPGEHERFTKYAMKNQSSRSLKKLLPRLTKEEAAKCLACHTTGYGKQGGFESFASTPHLANLGCESCHGPGSVHVESTKKADIVRKPATATCDGCHVGATVSKPLRYRPLRYAGAH